MEQEKKNQYILITVVVVLLFIVFSLGIFFAIKYKNQTLKNKGYVFNQVYYSEYKLDMIDENYYIGYLNDQQINVIVNKEGKEVFSNGTNIYYDGVYKTKEDNYIIYSNKDNHLVIYSFDGTKLEKLKDLNDVSYVKPILYTNGNIEYIVGFASQDNNNLYLYMLNDLETVVINNVSFVGDDLVQGVYYTYSDNSLVVMNTDSMFGVVDYSGKVIIDYKYTDLINTYSNSFIVKNKKGLYGIINKNGESIVKTKYKAIDLYSNYYLVVDSNDNMAVYDKDYKNITGFNMKYDSLLEYELRSNINSIYLWKVGNNLVVVNNYLQDINKTEFSKGNAYFIKNGKIDKTIKENGFANNGIVYSYDKKYKITVYDSELEEDYSFKLNDAKTILSISKQTDDIIGVTYMNKNDENKVVYYNKGTEVDFSYGDVLGKKDDIYIIRKEDKVTLYDKDLNALDSLDGEYTKYSNGYLIVDNGIYKIEKRS